MVTAKVAISFCNKPQGGDGMPCPPCARRQRCFDVAQHNLYNIYQHELLFFCFKCTTFEAVLYWIILQNNKTLEYET